jgi:hypothetical protein
VERRHGVVIEQVDRVVDREAQQRGAEGEGQAVELSVVEQPDRRGDQDAEHARQQRQGQAGRGAQRAEQDRCHAQERDARDPERVALGAFLACHHVAGEPALLEHESAAVGGVDLLEGRGDVAQQRTLGGGVETRLPGGEDQDGMAPVARQELTLLDAQRRLRAAQAFQQAAEGAERIGWRHLREQRSGGGGEIAAELTGALAESVVREQPGDLALRRVREEQQAPREVELEDLARQLRVGPAAQPGERRVTAQRLVEGAPRGDGAGLVGGGD